MFLATTVDGQPTAETAASVLAGARKIAEWSKALPEFEKALSLCRAEKNPRCEGEALRGIGVCQNRLGDPRKALESYRHALEIQRRIGDRQEEAKTLNNAGLVYWSLADYNQAEASYRRVETIARETGDTQIEGAVQNNLGLVLSDRGKYNESFDHFQRAIAVHRAAGREALLADPLGNLGGNYQLLGRYRAAIPYFEQSLEIRRRLVLRGIERDISNLALCYAGLGETSRALELFDQAIALAAKTGDGSVEADSHKGKGSALLRLGKYDAALDEYRRTLTVYERAGNKQKRGEALAALGKLHATLGDSASAEAHFKRSLEVARGITDERLIAYNLVALGNLEWQRKRYPQASVLLREALKRAQAAGDRARTASAQIQLALLDRDQKRYLSANSRAAAALAVAREAGANLLAAQALYALGESERLQGRPEPAIEHYSSGEEIARASGEPELGWRLAYGRGQSLEGLRRIDDAIESYRRAATIVESVRSQLREERFQAGYIQDKYQLYVALVRVLVESGKLAEAFAFAERMRARAYAGLLARNPRAPSPEEADLRERIRQLQRAVEAEDTDRPRRAEAIQTYSRELAEAERAYQNLLDDLRAPGSMRRPPVAALEEIQAALGPATALIEYVIDEDRVFAFVLTASRIEAIPLRLNARNLASKVDLLRALIANPGSDQWRKPAASLSSTLIAPLDQKGWLKGIRRLYVVPHQVLHYLPFAALPRGNRFLIDDFAIAVLPAASVLTGSKAVSPPRDGVLALAPARSRLRHTEEEARGIGELFSGANSVLTGAGATESAFKRSAGSYGVLHLATHASYNKLNPLLSGLELEPGGADDGRLEVHEILDLRLNARLVTLSACDTALGGGYFADVPAGDDFVGLTRAFLSAGAPSVLATLWEVDDRSTLILMQAFYQRLARSGKALSLAEAQRAMRREGSYQHPYFWAAFILSGKMD